MFKLIFQIILELLTLARTLIRIKYYRIKLKVAILTRKF